MPWKIVNLDHQCDRPHLHLKDPAQPIHLRTYFADGQVEVGLGAESADECPLRAYVSRDSVVVSATRFEPLYVRILASILSSLDVEPAERDEALAWMNDRVRQRAFDADGWLKGNVAGFPPPSGWPYELTNDALLESLRDGLDMPSTRRRALEREATRRGLRGAARETSAGPEIVRRPARRTD
jgi:hypothetical protein